MTRWLGPYVIEKCHDNGVVEIRTIDEEGILFLVNRYRLKAYKRPLSKEEFISTISMEMNVIGSVFNSSSSTSIKSEIGNMLEDFKGELLHTLTLKTETMQIKRKQEEAERALAFFFPRYTKRHLINECSLNLIDMFSVYEENHSTKKCPSLPGSKAVYQGTERVIEQLCYINQIRPQGPRQYEQGMKGVSYSYYNPNHNASIPPWCPPAYPSWSTFSLVFCTSIPFPTYQSIISAIFSYTTSMEYTIPRVEAPIQPISSLIASTSI